MKISYTYYPEEPILYDTWEFNKSHLKKYIKQECFRYERTIKDFEGILQTFEKGISETTFDYVLQSNCKTYEFSKSQFDLIWEVLIGEGYPLPQNKPKNFLIEFTRDKKRRNLKVNHGYRR